MNIGMTGAHRWFLIVGAASESSVSVSDKRLSTSPTVLVGLIKREPRSPAEDDEAG